MVLETVYVDLQVPAEPCPGSSIPPPRHPVSSSSWCGDPPACLLASTKDHVPQEFAKGCEEALENLVSFLKPSCHASLGDAAGASTCDFCPQDWLSHGGECYWFSQASKPWRGAQEDCVERRARMVMSRGRDELELLNNHTKGLYPIWIGVHVFPSTAEPDRSWTHGSTPDTNRAEDGSGEVCASKAWKGESSWVRKFAPAEPATKIFGGSAELRVNGDRRRWQRFWAAASEAAPGLGRFGRKRRLPE
ncbi:uncharacterized protein LOC142359657 isoform X6 [Opisthocomus hoazin]|uniref:uncharacterized protein LOC142359657 isoform X6 n=1 Tax=Opisthocomus hoazin TaxID=30419 RepID=UPI003F537670